MVGFFLILEGYVNMSYNYGPRYQDLVQQMQQGGATAVKAAKEARKSRGYMSPINVSMIEDEDISYELSDTSNQPYVYILLHNEHYYLFRQCIKLEKNITRTIDNQEKKCCDKCFAPYSKKDLINLSNGQPISHKCSSDSVSYHKLVIARKNNKVQNLYFDIETRKDVVRQKQKMVDDWNETRRLTGEKEKQEKMIAAQREEARKKAAEARARQERAQEVYKKKQDAEAEAVKRSRYSPYNNQGNGSLGSSEAGIKVEKVSPREMGYRMNMNIPFSPFNGDGYASTVYPGDAASTGPPGPAT